MYMLTILLYASSVQGMEKDYTQVVLAEEYSRNNPFYNQWVTLCDDILNHVFTHISTKDNDLAEQLENKIETLIKLSYTCTQFNKLLTLESISKLCDHYTQPDKNLALQRLISPDLYDFKKYAAKRFAALILICVGADPKTRGGGENFVSERFLDRAVAYNDVQIVRMAFKHGLDSDAGRDDFHCPFFFFSQTIEMIQVFIDAGIDIGMTMKDGHNLLYYLPSSELLDFYFKCGVDPKKQRDIHGGCLLHKLSFWCGDDSDKKARVLLGTMSDMINYLNWSWKTPIDVAQHEIEKNKEYLNNPRMNHEFINKTIENLECLIAVFREHGGKTALELKEQKLKVM